MIKALYFIITESLGTMNLKHTCVLKSEGVRTLSINAKKSSVSISKLVVMLP